MKKNLFMVAAVALMALISCNKEELPNNTNGVVFVAEFEQDASTKTTLGDQGEKGRKAKWIAGDKIKINGVEFTAVSDGYESKFELVDANAEFKKSESYFAIYPSVTTGNASGVKIPNVQDGTFASASIAVAMSSDNSLVFKNIPAILKFQVPVECNTVEITSASSLAGTPDIKFIDGSITVGPGISQGSKTITISNELVPGEDYYVAVAPISTFKHKLSVSIDGKLSKTSEQDVTFERSNIYNLGVLPKAKLSRDLMFEQPSLTATLGETFNMPKLNGVSEGVEYSSSNISVAKFDGNGSIILMGPGKTTITASAPTTEEFWGGEAAFELVVEKSFNVYVCISDLGWTSVNMHRYNASGDLTTWPGEALSEKVTLGSRTYYKKTISASESISYTFNNGTSNSNFKVDVKDALLEDIYYRLSARGAIEVDPNDVTTFGYAIYVFDQKSKNVAPNLYAWNDNNAWKGTYGGNFSSWPGVAFNKDCYYVPADGNNWKHYYYYEIPTSLYGQSFMFIVNKKGQTSDLSVTNLAGDLYVGYWYDSESSNGFWANSNLNTPITQ